MKRNAYIQRLSGRQKANVVGNKAQGLLFLKKYDFRVPESSVVVTEAFNRYLSQGISFLPELRPGLRKLPDVPYAVRSSTNVEDRTLYSFAGQFKTLLNVQGEDNILKAIEEIWVSATQTYHYVQGASEGRGLKPPACAVIIQEFIKPVLSGVGFSRNPVTLHNEVVIEAVEGPGEDLVQRGTTPLRWRIGGELINEGNTAYRYFSVIKKVAEDIPYLAANFGKPVDIEWVYDGRHLYYLQIREITGTKNLMVYSNRMAREMLPGQIKPLVWSVNIPLVNGTWISLLERITGPLQVTPAQLAKPFYYRAYFNLVTLGKIFRQFGFSAESLETMMLGNQSGMPRFKPNLKTLKHTFRIIRFMRYLYAFESFMDKEYAYLKNRFSELEREILTDFSLETYPVIYNKLFHAGQRIVHLNVIVQLLMHFHNRRLRKKLQKLRIDDEKIDFCHYFPELKDLSPLEEMKKIRIGLENLTGFEPQSCNSLLKLAELSGSAPVIEDFKEFLNKFGHLSDVGTDFSVEKWEENPEIVFQMILHTDIVKEKPANDRDEETDFNLEKNYRLKKLFLKAGTFRLYREKISSLYIYGYGLFRKLFLHFAKDLLNRNILDEPADVFYLRLDEAEQIKSQLASGNSVEIRDEISRRKREMADTREISLPSVIYGDEPPVLLIDKLKNIKGVGVSPGQYTGRTVVINHSGDFPKAGDGDVLLIPFADVSWTPVLARAGAIVSEAGGMLSHCSIIARELGIPAMVSADHALMTGDGVLVTVDGTNGVLTIYDHE